MGSDEAIPMQLVLGWMGLLTAMVFMPILVLIVSISNITAKYCLPVYFYDLLLHLLSYYIKHRIILLILNMLLIMITADFNGLGQCVFIHSANLRLYLSQLALR